MNALKGHWLPVLAAAVVVVGLPLAAHWARNHSESACALDGATINPAYRVKVQDAGGAWHAFCCPRCAQIWLENQPPPRAVTVTDETSGEEIAAASAYFVRSAVTTMPATGNRVHAFRSRADAERHAAAFQGTVLSASERPFR